LISAVAIDQFDGGERAASTAQHGEGAVAIPHVGGMDDDAANHVDASGKRPAWPRLRAKASPQAVGLAELADSAAVLRIIADAPNGRPPDRFLFFRETVCRRMTAGSKSVGGDVSKLSLR